MDLKIQQCFFARENDNKYYFAINVFLHFRKRYGKYECTGCDFDQYAHVGRGPQFQRGVATIVSGQSKSDPRKRRLD